MLSRFRHLFGVLFFLLIASCSGGGCSGCGSCAGMTPLPGGFPSEKAVQNAASVRISRPGLSFLETNLPNIVSSVANAPGGVIGFDIPMVDVAPTEIANLDVFGQVFLDPTVCPDGPDPNASPPRCRANVGIGQASLQLDALTPNALRIKGTLPLELEDTPIQANVSYKPPIVAAVDLGGIRLHIGYGTGGCGLGGKPNVSPKALPIGVVIPLVAESPAPRAGYTKVDVDNADIDISALSQNEVMICADCGDNIASAICSAITNSTFVKDLVVAPLKAGLQGQVRGILKDALCTKPNSSLNPACPTGTAPDAANRYCVYDTAKDKCVPMLLGTDGHAELGGLLRSISPSTAGGIDFGIASFGAMQPHPGQGPDAQGRTPNGMTLGMVGGVIPQPPSKCVTPKTMDVPTGIPIPDELAPTAIEGPNSSHVGIALSGRFLDYAFTNIYNSGLLCLGVSTEQVDMLKSGLLSFLIPSLKTLTFEQADAAAAVATRPQEPPSVKIGGGTNVNTDPLLTITLNKFALDVYIWSFDRFARVFTFTGDVTIPMNLEVAKGPNNPNGGLVPTLGDLKVANGAVSNADVLLLDDPQIVVGALSGVLATVAKQLTGSGIAPIDLSAMVSSLGLNLEVSQIKKLTKGSDDFVGIFASMSKKASTASIELETNAKLLDKKVWRDHMQASTYEKEKLPELTVALGSSLDDGRHAVEYSWWVDNGTRSPWIPVDRNHVGRKLVIKDDQLFFQGRHVLHVSSRLAGEPITEDATPSDIPYVIDALPPFVKLEKDAQAVRLKTWDIVSSSASLVARYRLDEREFSDWRPAAELETVAVSDAATIDFEVKDEEGNIGTVRQALRGRGDSTIAGLGSGCGCQTPGSNGASGGGVALLAGLAGLGMIVLRRLRARGVTSARQIMTRAGFAIGAIGAVAATSQGCACGSEGEVGSGCGSDCNQPCSTGLAKGQPGAYLSVAKAKDGSVWAAGYNDALLSDSDALLWGDLVVGKYDMAKKDVAWETVDGIPTRTDGTCGAYEPNGWRRGETESGDNVGRWASIQMSAKDQPMVSYYDDTHHRLKFAINDGGWKTIVLKEQAGADIGKYSKMVLVKGKPVITYLQLEPGNGGRTRSKIVMARAKVESPHEPEDFSFGDVAIDEDGPCRAKGCTGGDVCVKETGSCTKPTSGCVPGCSEAQACVAQNGTSVCLTKASEVETYPRGMGAYISVAPVKDTVAIVAYDGYHGNLVAMLDKGKSWERVVLDGETGNRSDNTAIDTGDVGIAASVAVGADGAWHVSYVNGIDETLRYIKVVDGVPGRSEVVDDGTSADGKPFPDGKHIVGDDSAIRVDGDKVTIFYADSSSLALRRALGTGSAGSTHKWALQVVPQENRWMAFPQFVPGEDKILTWWRQSTRATKSVEGSVTMLGF